MDTLGPIHGSDSSQDMGGIRALAAPCLEQAMDGSNLQNSVQQQLLPVACHQARTELA